VGTWSLFPHVIVRTTGFPFELVRTLAYERAAQVAERLVSSSTRLEAYRRDGPRIERPPKEVLKALRSGSVIDLDDVSRPHRFVEWNRLAGELLSIEREFQDGYDADEKRAQAATAQMLGDPWFLEAVASSSPPVFQDIMRGRLNSRVMRQVASYTQRFGAKNETMSFFGAINYGWLNGDGAPKVEISWSGPRKLKARNTYLAAWAVQGIAAAVASDPQVLPWLSPRRRSFGEFPSRKSPDGTKVEPSLLERLFHLADGTRTVATLARELNTDLATLAPQIALAFQKGLLTHQLEVPASLHRPVDDLIDRLAGLPGQVGQRHQHGLTAVVKAMEQYGASNAGAKVDLNDRVRGFVSQIWNVSREPPKPVSVDGQVRRTEGHNFYADRLPLREECGGDLTLTVGGPRARELVDNATGALEVLAIQAGALRAACRREVASRLGKAKLPFWKVGAALADAKIPRDPVGLEAVVRHAWDGKSAELDLGPLVPSLPPGPTLPIISTIDLLVGAKSAQAWEAGDYEVVLGDVHDAALIWGWALQFHPDRNGVERDLRQALAQLETPHPLITVLASRRTGLVPNELPGLVVELGSPSGRIGAWRAPLDDLWVESDGVDARLVSHALGCEVLLHNGELDTLAHTAFALPRMRALKVDLGPYTPRIKVGGVVLQRAQWRLPKDDTRAVLEVATERDRLKRAVDLWSSRGLPRFVFAKFVGERKPVLVDPYSPMLMRVFVNLLEAHPEVMLSEMRPDPDHLWLQGPEGRHTSELRCVFMRGAGGTA